MHDGVRQLQCCYLTLSASCCDSCTKSCCRLACMARHAGGVVWHLQSTSPDDLLKNIQRLHWGRPLNCQQFLALPLDRVVPLLVAFTFTASTTGRVYVAFSKAWPSEESLTELGGLACQKTRHATTSIAIISVQS